MLPGVKLLPMFYLKVLKKIVGKKIYLQEKGTLASMSRGTVIMKWKRSR
jgi:hypothetical protein